MTNSKKLLFNNYILFSELLEGSSMVAREKQKIERQEKEALLYKEVIAQNAS